MLKKYKDFYHRSSLKRLAYELFGLFSLISKLIPKNEKIKLFGSMYGFKVADNSKYKFINEYKDGYYYIVKNKKILNKVIFDEVKPIYCYSFKGIYLQLVASEVYYSHAVYDFNPILVWGSKKIALWHGVPVKEIGPRADWGNLKIVRKLKQNLFARIFPHAYYMYCDSVVCPFPDRIEDYRRYFSIAKPQVLIERQPRTIYARKLPKKNQILFAPTHRMQFSNFNMNEYLKKTGLMDERLVNELNKSGIELVIRPHPIDKETFKEMKLPENYRLDFSDDIYETINHYKLIITDFSSLYYDAIELGIVARLVVPDLDEWQSKVGVAPSFFEEFTKNGRESILHAVCDLK